MYNRQQLANYKIICNLEGIYLAHPQGVPHLLKELPLVLFILPISLLHERREGFE